MSRLPWFRLYSRIVDDKKIKLLAFEDRWHFVALCCLKCAGDLDEQDDDLLARTVAVGLGVQLAELDEIKRRLASVKLIDERFNPVAWDDLQFQSDGSAKRMREYRKRKKEQSDTVTKRNGDVTVTPQETDKDTEQNIEPKGSCASGDALKPEHVSEKWNEIATRLWGGRTVRDMTPSRRQLVKARIAQYSLEDFVAVFGKIEASPFLRGDGGWRGCTFDWVMKRANFQKIIEGNYDD